MNSFSPCAAYVFMMCHRIGWPPIATIGLGLTSDSSRKRVPRPPHRMMTGGGVASVTGFSTSFAISPPAEKTGRRDRRARQLAPAQPAGQVVAVVVEPDRRREPVEPVGPHHLERICRVHL